MTLLMAIFLLVISACGFTYTLTMDNSEHIPSGVLFGLSFFCCLALVVRGLV